jgi:P27 family predicted phage terminase small subunit
MRKPRTAFLDAHDVFSYGCCSGEGLKSMAKVPKRLGKAGRELWQAMIATFEFNDAEEALLKQACYAADEAGQARAVLEREGYTVTAPGGKLVQHPCCLTLRDARNFIAKVMRQLEPKRAAQHQPRPSSWGLGVTGR